MPHRKSSDRPTRRVSRGRIQAVALVLLALLQVSADLPRTRVVELRWKHPGEVAGFKIYTRLWSQEWGPPLDVGLPRKTNGVFRYSLEISNYDATYVAVSAYDARQLEGRLSNERLFLLPDPKTESQ